MTRGQLREAARILLERSRTRPVTDQAVLARVAALVAPTPKRAVSA